MNNQILPGSGRRLQQSSHELGGCILTSLILLIKCQLFQVPVFGEWCAS